MEVIFIQNQLTKLLADIRETIYQVKHDICVFLDEKDDLLDKRVDKTENALCEYSFDIDKSITNIENALCELSILLDNT